MSIDHNVSVERWESTWKPIVAGWVHEQMQHSDSAHDLEHIKRVVTNALRIGSELSADPEVYLPACWLHDCVAVAKDSPQRKQASRMAAAQASSFLASVQYPESLIPQIVHCIESHSFSANIPCATIEAEIVQDADRLEALGAIGIARCLMTGGSMRQRLYHPDDPFPIDREPEDTVQSIDHFFAKLLGLHRTMKTAPGRAEAIRRTTFLADFLKQLGQEIGQSPAQVQSAIDQA